MTAYGFDFIGRDGSIQSVTVGEFATPMDAVNEARAALAGSLAAVGGRLERRAPRRPTPRTGNLARQRAAAAAGPPGRSGLTVPMMDDRVDSR